MKIIKIIFLICLLFAFFFVLMKLKILLSPKTVTFLDERIDFDLFFEDTNKLKCTLTKEKIDKIYEKN